MSGQNDVVQKILKIFNNNESNKKVSEIDILQKLRVNFNYDYPILTRKNHNKIIIKKDEKLLKYSFNYFTILYNGILSYISTYISWLNLFCYEFFLDIKFKETSVQDIDTIDNLRENLYDKCKIKKDCGTGKKLSKLTGNSTKQAPGMINAVHLLKYMITNVKNNKQNVTTDFCILTDDFINYIKIYFDTIPKFKSAYSKRDFDKYKKKTITFNEAYHSNFKKYATFILENINILFQNKILLDNLYTDYDYKNTLIPSKNLREQTAKNLANDAKNKKIMNNSNTTIFSTYLYHAAIDKPADEDTTKIIMGKLLKASNQQKFGVYVCDVDIKNKKIKLNKKIKNKFTILGKKFGISEGSYKKVLDSMNTTFLHKYIVLNKTVRVYYQDHPEIHNNDSGWVDMKDVIKSGMINGTEVDKDALQYIKAIRNKIERDKINSTRKMAGTVAEMAAEEAEKRKAERKARAMNRARAEAEKRKVNEAAIRNTEERKVREMNEEKAAKRKANANAAAERKAIEAQQNIFKQIIEVPVGTGPDKYANLFNYKYNIKKPINFADTYLHADTFTVSYDGKMRISKCKMKYNGGEYKIKCKEFREYLSSMKHLSPAELKEIIEFIPIK